MCPSVLFISTTGPDLKEHPMPAADLGTTDRAQYVADTVAIAGAGIRVPVDGSTITLSPAALDTLAALDDRHAAWTDGTSIWVDGTAYPVTR